jgi:glycosyltransferase involved in cell wall biosynthesis
MSGKRLYYRLKPYIPWSVRIRLRRAVAQRQRRLHSHNWPINELAGEIPEHWPGWPDGKKFAFVLTHDVERREGLDKCRQLMQLERELGFHSSFNFIPEGEYRVSPGLRAELAQNGFEVGVHDLRHDGKLYWSREEFGKNARRINQYLKAWGAGGFRSGFMLHDRESLHELDIEYDASTFDTDPFEPQPEGVQTIFPFWVSRPSGGGYVEMPYTLPQDSTMFLVLKETSSDIWKKKLDWIVQRGGMALVNVHPDYMGFDRANQKADEFSSALYEDFLKHVKENYGGQYWQALPREVARWYRETHSDTRRWAASETFSGRLHPAIPSPEENPLKGKSAAVVLYSYYASDPRPRREAEALGRAGMDVDVICLRQDAEEPWRETINGINVFHVPLQRRRGGKFNYVFLYLSFLISSFFLLSAWSFKKRYRLVHVHNMPDFLVFSGLIPKLLGAKIILDLHDPMPELMVTIFGLQEKSFGVRLLKFLEKISIGFVDQVITVNLACKKIFSARSCPPEKILVLMNVPDETIFKFRDERDYEKRNAAKPFVIMYHGSIVERNGLDLAVEALKLCREKIPNAELRIYGATTAFLDSVMDYVRKNNLSDVVHHLGAKTLDEITVAIQDCDIGIIPNRLNAFTEINTPTRIFEYLSLGKPVIAPRAPGITDYFNAQDLIFFELGNVADLAKKIEFAATQPEAVGEITQRGQAIYQAQRWSRAKESFLNRVGELLGLSRETRSQPPVPPLKPVGLFAETGVDKK